MTHLSSSRLQPDLSIAPKGLMFWLRLTALVSAFNALLAVVLYLSNPEIGNLFGVVVYAEAIGLSIFLIHSLLDLLPRFSFGEVVHEAISIVIAAPSGYLTGSRLAAFLLNDQVAEDLPRSQLAVAIIASVCVVYFFWSRNRIHEESVAHARAKQLASEAELRLLRAQIEPHMLFNTLANLRVLVGLDPHRAETMIDQLIVFLRSSLSASRTEMRSIEAEFEQLVAYLSLMKVRMAERLEFDLACPPEARAELVPAMLLQPLAENAIKHGLEPAVSGGRLSIHASVDQQHVRLGVTDTGIGFAADENTGYGLAHIRERLKALYGDRAQFKIERHPEGGTVATLLLPRRGSNE